jgi:enoyl-CoA hydratase/3-hydroxyacyl-CoA dehydrogenase
LTGQKTGKGIYQYDEKRRAKPDPEIRKYVQKAQEIANIMPGGKVLPGSFFIVELLNYNLTSPHSNFFLREVERSAGNLVRLAYSHRWFVRGSCSQSR